MHWQPPTGTAGYRDAEPTGRSGGLRLVRVPGSTPLLDEWIAAVGESRRRRGDRGDQTTDRRGVAPEL